MSLDVQALIAEKDKEIEEIKEKNLIDIENLEETV